MCSARRRVVRSAIRRGCGKENKCAVTLRHEVKKRIADGQSACDQRSSGSRATMVAPRPGLVGIASCPPQSNARLAHPQQPECSWRVRLAGCSGAVMPTPPSRTSRVSVPAANPTSTQGLPARAWTGLHHRR